MELDLELSEAKLGLELVVGKLSKVPWDPLENENFSCLWWP